MSDEVAFEENDNQFDPSQPECWFADFEYEDRQKAEEAFQNIIQENRVQAAADALANFKRDHFFIKADPEMVQLIENLIIDAIEDEERNIKSRKECLLTMISSLYA